MKKSMKTMAFALSAVMMLGALSGCGGKQTSGDGEVTTISVWTVNSHSQAVYEELVNEYNETIGKEKGIKIDYQVKPGDSMAQNLELALQSGTAPDLFGSGDMKKMADNGDIWAIEDLPGGTEYLKRYEGFINQNDHTHNGKTYTVPVSSTVGGLVYNKDMFKATGIVDENGEAKAPVTWDDVREYAKILTNPDTREYGIIYPIKWGNDSWYSSDVSTPSMGSYGYTWYNPGTGKWDYTHQKEIVEAIIGMKEDGSVYPGGESLDNDSARALFSEGKVGMKIAFSFDVGVFNDQFPATCDWGVAPYPVVDANGTLYKQSGYTGGGLFINKKSNATPEQLMEVMKFFTSDEFLKETYKAGVDLPYDAKIAEGVELGADAKKGWKEFAEIVGITRTYITEPKRDYAGLRKAGDIFVEEIYSGKISIEEGLQKMTENANQATDNYYSAHPDEDRYAAVYYNPDWKPEVR